MPHDLVSRAWNGTPISRRTADGYVNATAMCKANSKEWKHYFETDRAHRYLEALEGSVGIPTDRLFTSITTGPNEGRGTWVHPQVAVDLARWISAPFAVWMDGWFLEEVSQVRDTQPSYLPTTDVLQMVERSIGLLDRLGGLDERASMLLRDVVLNETLKAAGGSGPLLEATKEFTLSEVLVQYGCPAHKATELATRIGRQVKALYRQDNGRDPKKQPQLVGGRRVEVALYEFDWLESKKQELVETIEQFVG